MTAGVPQGSVLGPLFFLIYINDLVDYISSEAKLFADDTSLFTFVYDVDIAANRLNRDLEIISTWAYQWKMQFNPDKNKQTNTSHIFPEKRSHVHLPLFFSESEVVIKAEHKHLGMILDSKLTFLSHIKEAIVEARRGIGIIRFLSKYVSRDVLDQIYKLYVRPHLDYGDIIYHKYDPEFKLDFRKRLESTQYSAALAVSGAWRGTQTRFTKNLAEKSFIIEDGTDVYVNFINCKVIKDHYTYTTKYHINVISVTIYEDQTCLDHLQKALTDLLTLISKIVSENGTN